MPQKSHWPAEPEQKRRRKDGHLSSSNSPGEERGGDSRLMPMCAASSYSSSVRMPLLRACSCCRQRRRDNPSHPPLYSFLICIQYRPYTSWVQSWGEREGGVHNLENENGLHTAHTHTHKKRESVRISKKKVFLGEKTATSIFPLSF